jgi:sulfotransferase family protein
MDTDKCLYAYFGHHKCASQWIRAVISDICSLLGLKLMNVSGPGRFNSDLKAFVLEKGMDFLTYTNADFSYICMLENFIGFHVIRDPRDIAVSAYFSHRYSHSTDKWPELIEHREKLKQVSLEDGLYIEMDMRKKQFDKLFNWQYPHSNILELKMEDMIINSESVFKDVFVFLGLMNENLENISSEKSISVKQLESIIDNQRFDKKSGGRKQGEENLKNHYRKGISGDWENHFSPGHVEYFKSRYNDLLLKLGYERDEDWGL